jgi:hypothetical protein
VSWRGWLAIVNFNAEKDVARAHSVCTQGEELRWL